jgi:hypothetical protein
VTVDSPELMHDDGASHSGDEMEEPWKAVDFAREERTGALTSGQF